MTFRKQWSFYPDPDRGLVQQLSQQFQLDPLIASILIRRGYHTIETVQEFLNPRLNQLRDPYQMKDMPAAVELLKSAIVSEKRIAILGDYDVDGITATAMLMMFFQACGCHNLAYFIPNRFEHGYGLTSASGDVLLDMKPEVVVTVDNGITAVAEVRRLRENGIETVITDHHLSDSGQIPEGVVVNPNRPDCNYPFKGISGCGVALKVLMALRKALRESGFWTAQRPEPNLKWYMDLAAMGTVADVVPLIDENRLLVHQGLQMMNQQPRVGIQILAQLCKAKSIDTHTLGFQFGPLLNAAGRMKNASIAVDLLLSTHWQEAYRTARQLEDANYQRRETESHMLSIAVEQAQARKDHSSLVVVSADFHEGISGIVAARLVERYYKPALVLAENGEHYKGSARSIPELHIRDTLAQCGDHLEKFGGHAGAAGLLIRKTNLASFMEQFEQVCASTLTPHPEPKLWVDGELGLDQIHWELIQQLSRLEPYGAHNARPLFVIEAPRQEFHVLKDKHIKWNHQGIEIMGWNLAERFTRERPQQLAVEVGTNEFRGRRSIQLVIEEYR